MRDVIQRGLDEPGTPFAFHFAPAMRHHPQGAAPRLDEIAMDHSYASSELQTQKGSSLSIEYHASLIYSPFCNCERWKLGKAPGFLFGQFQQFSRAIHLVPYPLSKSVDIVEHGIQGSRFCLSRLDPIEIFTRLQHLLEESPRS